MFRKCRLSLTWMQVVALGLPLLLLAGLGGQAPPKPNGGSQPILQYITSDWDALTRSMTRCESVADPKVPHGTILYVPAELASSDALRQLQETCAVRVETLPAHPEQPGLLFLPNPYVVPGGRFNEMYGWDSYFIMLGLLKDGRFDLAEGMLENFFFEIEYYGKVLNANRTYYLSRSQPPFLSSMTMAIYNARRSGAQHDKPWLARAYKYIERDYILWTSGAHLAGSTGLSRYYDLGDGPAPESVHGEPGYYREVASYFLIHPDRKRFLRTTAGVNEPDRGVGESFQVKACDQPDSASAPCSTSGSVRLSAAYYKGDRSMRESGFDVSFRFGPYGSSTQNFAPVCLNSLLYKTEKDLEMMSRLLGKPKDAEKWSRRAEQRKQRMNKFLWNAQQGLFFDYNFVDARQSTYEYATTFYPLWAGMASPEQADAVTANLHRFEQPGGLVTSPYETGAQWDYPYGWAPLQMLAAEGLHRYARTGDAERIANKFLSMIVDNFRRDGTIREKYNVVSRSSEVAVHQGYADNVVGFGWTNGVFLELLHLLPKAEVERLVQSAGGTQPTG